MDPLTPDTVRPATDGPPPGTLDEQVEWEVLDQFARSPQGLLAGFVPLALTYVLLRVLAAPPLLLPWALAVALGLGVGIALSFAYRRQPPALTEVARWRRRYVVFTGALGLAWGAAGWLFVPGPWQAEMVILILLAVLSATVLADLGANFSPFVAYVCGATLPTAIGRAWLGGALNLALSLGALATLAVLTLFAARQAATTRRSLRVAHENRRLAQALAERTRQAEQASLAKSRLIAAASHDLRQPVHALGLQLDVLQGQQLNAQAQATAARMAQVLESLDAMFEGLLDLSRLDSGVVKPRHTEFAIGPLLAALADEFSNGAQAKGLALRCRGSAARVRSDRLLLERMLRNLLANAVRYTGRGGIVVGCRRRGAWLSIEVWDSGVGIAPHLHKDVFDEFFQVDSTRRLRDQGLGLGLAIVSRLGALLGHAVELRSRPGRGSVFKVGVPMMPAAATAGAARPAADSPDALPADLRRRHLLLVEDDVGARDALTGWLTAWGCRVTSCASAEAVDAALGEQACAPDALITDWPLAGGAGGLDLTRRVRQRFGPALPAILITAGALDDARRLADEHAVLLLRKPVRPASLRAALAAQCMPPTPSVGAPP